MKTQARHSILALTMVAAVNIIAVGCNKSDTQKIGSDVKVTAQDTATATKDAFTTGKDKVVEVATNTVAAVKEGAQKVGEVTTNVAAKVKSASSNAWSDTKSVTTNTVNKLNDLIH